MIKIWPGRGVSRRMVGRRDARIRRLSDKGRQADLRFRRIDGSRGFVRRWPQPFGSATRPRFLGPKASIYRGRRHATAPSGPRPRQTPTSRVRRLAGANPGPAGFACAAELSNVAPAVR